MTNSQNLQKQNLLNQLKDLNKKIFEDQAIENFNIGKEIEQIKQLQNFKSNNAILESIRDELLITLNSQDINQFLTTFA